MTQVRLEPANPRSRVKYSTTEPLRSLHLLCALCTRLFSKSYTIFWKQCWTGSTPINIWFFWGSLHNTFLISQWKQTLQYSLNASIWATSNEYQQHLYFGKNKQKSGLQIRVYWITIFFISSPKHMLWVLKKKNRLNKTILLSTQNTRLNWWVRNYLQFYAHRISLSGSTKMWILSLI